MRPGYFGGRSGRLSVRSIEERCLLARFASQASLLIFWVLVLSIFFHHLVGWGEVERWIEWKVAGPDFSKVGVGFPFPIVGGEGKPPPRSDSIYVVELRAFVWAEAYSGTTGMGYSGISCEPAGDYGARCSIHWFVGDNTRLKCPTFRGSVDCEELTS